MPPACPSWLGHAGEKLNRFLIGDPTPLIEAMVPIAFSFISVAWCLRESHPFSSNTKVTDSGVRDEPNLVALPHRCSVHCRVSAHFRLPSESGSLSASVSFLSLR